MTDVCQRRGNQTFPAAPHGKAAAGKEIVLHIDDIETVEQCGRFLERLPVTLVGQFQHIVQVALVSARVEVSGTPPGMLATP